MTESPVRHANRPTEPSGATPDHAVRAYALMFLAGAIWGSTFSFAKLATADGAHPLGLTFWQGWGGALVLFAVCLWRGTWPPLTRRFVQFYVLLGFLGTAAPSALFFYAAPHVPAGILAITVATVPLITYAGSMLLRIDAFSVRRCLGIVVGFVAIVVLLVPESSLPDRAIAFWVGLVLTASVLYSIEAIYVAVRVPEHTDMVTLLTGMLVAAGAMMLPVVIATDSYVALSWPWGPTEWAVVGMALSSSLAYAMFLRVVQIAGPVFSAQIGYVITISGVFWGMVFFGESHSAGVWIALALMLAGLALVTPVRARRNR